MGMVWTVTGMGSLNVELPEVNEIPLCLHVADFNGKSSGIRGNRPFSHTIHTLS
jgi:hypothetical protein